MPWPQIGARLGLPDKDPAIVSITGIFDEERLNLT